MNDYFLFIKRVGLIGIVRLFAQAQSLILVPILAKSLGASGYGIWAQIGVTIALVMPFVMLGLPSAMVRFLSEKKDKKEFSQGFFMVISIIFLAGIIAASLLFLLSKFISISLFRDVSITPFLQLASLIIIFEALNTVTLESFRILGQIKKYSLLVISQICLEVVSVGFLVLSGFGLRGVIIGFLMAKIITFLISLLTLISRIGFALPNFSLLRPHLIFGLPLIPESLFLFFIESSDRYVVGFFKGAASVGIYSVAYGLGVIPAIFMSPISYILSPTVFKFYREGELGKVKNLLSYSLKYFLLLAIPSTFGLFILSKPLLIVLTTPEFVSINSAFIVLLLSLSMIFEGVRAIFGITLMIFKKTGILAKAVFIAGTLNIVLNIIFIPYFGIIAAAATTLFAYIVLGGMYFYTSREYLKFNINPSFVIRSILSSIIMVVAIYVLNPLGIIKILLAIGVGVIVYFLILFLLKGIGRKEVEIIKSVLFNKAQKD